MPLQRWVGWPVCLPPAWLHESAAGPAAAAERSAWLGPQLGWGLSWVGASAWLAPPSTGCLRLPAGVPLHRTHPQQGVPAAPVHDGDLQRGGAGRRNGLCNGLASSATWGCAAPRARSCCSQLRACGGAAADASRLPVPVPGAERPAGPGPHQPAAAGGPEEGGAGGHECIRMWLG